MTTLHRCNIKSQRFTVHVCENALQTNYFTIANGNKCNGMRILKCKAKKSSKKKKGQYQRWMYTRPLVRINSIHITFNGEA